MDYLDSIDKILPVVFFIIWIFFGLFVKSKKRQGASRDTKSGSGGMGELGKVLRKTFEEIQGPVIAADPEFETDSYEDDVQDDFSDAERSRPVPESAPVQPDGHSPRQQVLSAVAPPLRSSSRIKAKLRQGIIMSEILSPPVALRE